MTTTRDDFTMRHLLAWCEAEVGAEEAGGLRDRMVAYLDREEEWDRASVRGWRWVHDWMVDEEACNRQLALRCRQGGAS